MKKLEEIKGKIVEMPEQAKRYLTVVWDDHSGWNLWNTYNLFTTPEDATQALLQNPPTGAEYYTVIELDLKIPISN